MQPVTSYSEFMENIGETSNKLTQYLHKIANNSVYQFLQMYCKMSKNVSVYALNGQLLPVV